MFLLVFGVVLVFGGVFEVLYLAWLVRFSVEMGDSCFLFRCLLLRGVCFGLCGGWCGWVGLGCVLGARCLRVDGVWLRHRSAVGCWIMSEFTIMQINAGYLMRAKSGDG